MFLGYEFAHLQYLTEINENKWKTLKYFITEFYNNLCLF